MSAAEKLKGLMSKKVMYGATVTAALFFMFVGVIFWGGFNTAMEATNTLEFCISCHEMEENVYQEYTHTIHFQNRSGVRATCSDCHVPDPWVHKVVRKIQASNELWHKALGSIDTPEKFDAKRLTLAKNVWHAMKDTDSRECRNCHDFKTMQPENQKPRARKQHLNAMTAGNTCIDCHKGIAHKNVHDQLTDEELDALTKPDPSIAIEIPQHWQDFLDKEEAEKLAQKKAAEEAALLAAEKAKQAEIEAAELAKKQQEQASKAQQKAPKVLDQPQKKQSQSASISHINWAAVPARTITVFYPGQASIEWVLGREHGGKRSFKKGDRCIACHEEEAADVGQKIVSGEKLEDKFIPNKRGSIAVAVRAAHDSENLYLQFSWEGDMHHPAPFIEGGKMDVENPIKLALMLATDEVEYADRAGCWGTCHADLNDMPFAPAGQDVTKYIGESRTDIEIKGRNDKPLGGWDKRKSQNEIDTEFTAQHFMDIIRYKSGEKTVEDGHVLADRIMNEAVISQAQGVKQGNKWLVEFKRPLSQSEGNLGLDLDKQYNFGFAIHDDHTNGRFHHVSFGYKLGFDNGEVEINAVKQ